MGEPWHYTYAPGKYAMVNKWSAVQKGETLNPGDCGPGVIEMKKCLVKWGVWPKLWRIDNKYAGRTGVAVKKFQKAHHLIADGVVGPTTWKALLSNPIVKVKRPIVKTPTAPKPGPNAEYFADIYEGDKYESVAYKNAHYRHIVLKATEGRTFVDSTFVERWSKSTGQIRWAYHFARPSNNTPEAEAANFAGTLHKVKFTSNDRVVLDWEDPKFNSDGTVWVQKFVDAMLKYGFEVRVLYSYGGYLGETVKTWPKSKSGPLRYWHAAYIVKPEITVPPVAKKYLYAIQYTDGQNGNMPHTASGIGPCDMSYVK
jgi:peptidoglycan hydrolase-like protein with peptidoglycan-binding domain